MSNNDMKHNDQRPDGKPAKPARTSKRFAFHECYHHDAWIGLLTMPPDEVGVYWRLILLCYIRRAALSDGDDAEIAALCHMPLKRFRFVKRKLIDRGRLEYDAENRVYHDKRAIEELIRLGFFSQAQTERAFARWDKQNNRPRLAVDNVGPLSAANSQLLGTVGAKTREVPPEVPPEVPLKYPLKSEPVLIESTTSLMPGACQPVSNTHITTPDRPESSATRAARSPRGGGAQAATGAKPQRHNLSIDEWRAEQRRKMGLGADEPIAEAPRPTPAPGKRQISKAADRTAKRSGPST